MNSPAGPGASGGASGGAAGTVNEAPAPGRGAQDRAIPEKQQKAQQAPSGTQAPTTKQSQGERDKSAPTKQSQDAQQPAQQRQQQTQQPSTGGSKQGAGTPGTAGGQGGAMRSSNVSFTTEQKTTIRSTVMAAPRRGSPTSTSTSGSVRWCHGRCIAPVPVTLVEIQPTWRGFMYFV